MDTLVTTFEVLVDRNNEAALTAFFAPMKKDLELKKTAT